MSFSAHGLHLLVIVTDTVESTASTINWISALEKDSKIYFFQQRLVLKYQRATYYFFSVFKFCLFTCVSHPGSHVTFLCRAPSGSSQTQQFLGLPLFWQQRGKPEPVSPATCSQHKSLWWPPVYDTSPHQRVSNEACSRHQLHPTAQVTYNHSFSSRSALRGWGLKQLTGLGGSLLMQHSDEEVFGRGGRDGTAPFVGCTTLQVPLHV